MLDDCTGKPCQNQNIHKPGKWRAAFAHPECHPTSDTFAVQEAIASRSDVAGFLNLQWMSNSLVSCTWLISAPCITCTRTGGNRIPSNRISKCSFSFRSLSANLSARLHGLPFHPKLSDPISGNDSVLTCTSCTVIKLPITCYNILGHTMIYYNMTPACIPNNPCTKPKPQTLTPKVLKPESSAL